MKIFPRGALRGCGDCRALPIRATAIIAVSVMTILAAGAATFAANPAGGQEPSAQPADNKTEPFRVEGFRSARWGMSDAQVKVAIHRDFNIPPERVHTEENTSERTTILSVTVGDILEGAGKARLSYILGFATKKLIQINIVWGSSIDPQAKPDLIVAAANQLRTLFLSYPYQADTVASNVATSDGTITVFQGQDIDKHMTLLRLVSTPAAPPSKNSKIERAEPRVVLLLSYVLDAKNPDVYRLKKGQF